MRSEQEMLDLIVDTAKCDKRIRAAIMNGSRANPNAPRDIFQDFDIVYLVTEPIPANGKSGSIYWPDGDSRYEAHHARYRSR
jgi:hypothetical protein